MINFVDREPTQPGRRKITHEDGTSEYVTMSLADNPDVAGTPLNRATLMAMQGFETTTTTFNADGSVTETNSKGDTLTTSFNSNGSVVERFKGANGMTIAKTITFSGNNINEVVSE